MTFVALDQLASAFTNVLVNGHEGRILQWDELDRLA
jgi:hypothetical protein